MSERNYNIMLVEDSASQATRLIAILEKEGWQVHWANSAEEAFGILREHRPDLVLLDYYLPGMRGDEICRRIRMNIDSRSLPIVMLTSQENHELHGLDSGADDFIVKSANSDILLLRLRTLLQKSHADTRILAGGSGNSFRSARLLAIDDSPTFLERLRPELETEGYELETSLDPQDSLRRIGQGSYDGVIIDLVMPTMDGIQVCRGINEMRKKMEFPLITIILTGAETKENLSKALEAGADDFVGKSNDFSILKGRIRALLRRKFFAEENSRILQELREKELEALRERSEKEAAQARAALVEQLQASTAELNRSREELKRANEAKDQFLAVLSHELRTPLTPILALVTDRCEDPKIDAELREDLTMIRRNIELEARLIDDLLDLTRITKGKLEIRDDEVDVLELVQHAVEMCSTAGSQAKIIQEITAQKTIMRGDSMRLTQVFWNLLRNAIKFTSSEGTIHLRVFNEPALNPNRIILEITDTGIGIEPEMLRRIFDAFEQGSRRMTRQFGGLGLGLAISKAIVDLHEGTLSASSPGQDKGATFRVELPAVSRLEPDSLVLPVCAPMTPAPTKPKEKKTLRILLVEDHADTRAIMERLLKIRGHEVLVAGTVANAIEVAQTSDSLDLLISDLGLPDGSGFDVLREITNLQPVKGIALSGYGMENDVQRSLDAGFKLHLIKPVDFQLLERQIAEMFAE